MGKPRSLGPAPLGEANGFYRYVSVGGHVYGVDWSLGKSTAHTVPAVFNLS